MGWDVNTLRLHAIGALCLASMGSTVVEAKCVFRSVMTDAEMAECRGDEEPAPSPAQQTSPAAESVPDAPRATDNRGSGSSEEQGTNPVSKYVALLRIQYLTCSLAIKLDLATGNASLPEYTKCKRTADESLRDAYHDAKKHIGGRKEARRMLDDLYAMQKTAFNGLLPEPSEMKMLYDARVSRTGKEIEFMGNRLKIELGIE